MDLQAIDWKRLLTSFEGRIDRIEFWVGFVAAFVVALIAGYVGGLIGNLIPYVGGIVSLAIGVVALYPAVAVAIKRLHDRDKPDFWLAVYFGPYVVSLLLSALGMLFLISFGFLYTILSLASLAAFLYMAYDLGWLEGSPEANAHGPAPAKGATAKAA
jgi:uncharacterized membrane protein YhaH (DUF805 family)